MQFFGSGEVARLVPACVTEFRAGVHAGFHTKATRIRSVFRRALCEVVEYFVVRQRLLACILVCLLHTELKT